MTGLVYLAEPIDQAAGIYRQGVEDVRAGLAEQGWLIFRPKDAWMVNAEAVPNPTLERVNRAALEGADVLMAYLPLGVPTVGVPREIEAATALGIPTVVILLPGQKPGWALADQTVVYSPDQALAWAKEQLGRPPRALRDGIIHFSLGERGYMPLRTHDGDAGWDLYCSEERTVRPGEFVDIPTGVRAALPRGVWLRICGRSSTLRKRGLLCAEGVIDSGYRGELFGGVWNLTNKAIQVERGDRLIQMVPHTNITPGLSLRSVSGESFDLIPSVDRRGDGGFGSTGA